MAQQSPSPANTSGTGSAPSGARLSGGVIATLAGWWTRRWERSSGSGSACYAGIVVG